MSNLKMTNIGGSLMFLRLARKSLILFSLCLMAAIFFNSCKEELTQFEDTSEMKDVAPVLDTGSDGDGQPEDRKIDCPRVKASVVNEGDILVFDDMLHFWECAECIERDYDAYNDAYDAQYPDATPEELDKLDEANNFDQWLPYKNFEESKKFTSLRSAVEDKIVKWLLTPADKLDFNDNPDLESPIIMENVRALFNVAGEVKIGKEILTQDYFNEEVSSNSGSLEGEKSIFDACGFATTSTTTFNSNNSGLPNNRFMVMRVGVRSGLFTSNLFGRMTHFKNNTNFWNRKRARMSCGIYGFQMTGECQLGNAPWAKFKSKKKRSVRKVTHSNWLNWREAYVCNANPNLWPILRSYVYGSVNNDNYPYNVILMRNPDFCQN